MYGFLTLPSEYANIAYIFMEYTYRWAQEQSSRSFLVGQTSNSVKTVSSDARFYSDFIKTHIIHHLNLFRQFPLFVVWQVNISIVRVTQWNPQVWCYI